ncbi:MAG: hypothetical protein KDK25_03990 [Leptospiraceae bacterium]|nr:hypothetical protein [Leptospiraceae bacterium]
MTFLLRFVLHDSMVYRLPALRIALGSALLLVFAMPRSAWPCGPGEPDPLRIFRPLQITSAIQPNAKDRKYLRALEKSAGSCTLPALPEEGDPNINQWIAYVQKGASFAPSHEEMSTLVFEAKAGELQNALSGKGKNELAMRLARSGQKAMLEYLLFAKSLEPLVVYSGGYWDVREPVSEEKANPQIALALKSSDAAKDELKNRYLFQAMRLAHYSAQYERTVQLYLQKASSIGPEDPLYFRIQHLYAGALLRTGKVAEGLQVMASMAAKDPEQLDRVALDFERYYNEKGAFESAFKKADLNEKKQLLLLKFFSEPTPGLKTIQTFSQMFPGDPALDYMLIREIDRLEDRLEEPLYYSRTESRRAKGPSAGEGDEREATADFSILAFLKDVWNWFVPSLEAAPMVDIPAEEQAYMKELSSFIHATVEKKMAPSEGVWTLAEAYLQMLLGKHSETEKLLGHDSVQKGSSPFVQLQRRRLALLNASAASKSLDDALRARILKDYESIAPTNANSEMDYTCRWSDHAARLMLHENMVRLHSSQKQYGMALLWEPNVAQVYSGMPLNTYDFAALEQAVSTLKEPSSKYEEKLANVSGLSVDTVLARLGGRKMKAGEYSGAVAALSRISAPRLKDMYYSDRIAASPFQNPFQEKFESGKKARDYDSLLIARKLQELEKTAESGDNEKSARAYYLMGLAQFNMSHFGHWWSAVDTDWSIYYEYSDKQGDPQLNLARSYFKKAIEKARDPEILAASRFMIATISFLDSAGMDYSPQEQYSLTEEQKEQFKKLSGLENTKFYRDVIRACSYYMNFRN